MSFCRWMQSMDGLPSPPMRISHNANVGKKTVYSIQYVYIYIYDWRDPSYHYARFLASIHYITYAQRTGVDQSLWHCFLGFGPPNTIDMVMNRLTGIKDFALTSTEDVEVILWMLGTRSHLPEQLEGVDLGCGKFCTFTKHGLFKDVIWCWYYLPKRRPWGICLRHLRFGEWVSALLKRPSKVALKIFWWTKTRINTVHPGRLTWNIIMEVGKMIFLSKWVIYRFHVNLPGCNQLRTLSDLYDSCLQWTIPYNPTVQRNQSWKKFFSSSCMGQSVSHVTAENRG